jgi:ABC-type nitrate/sulfonate/bicarbonate transport system substrate-binding protein
LNPKGDVSITQVGSAATRLTALQAGSIDAAVLTLGLFQIGQKSGLNLLLDFIEKDIEYQQVAIIARDDLLKSRADLVRRFMKSYLDSVRFYKTQKEVAIRETMKRLRMTDRAIGEFDYNQRARSLPDDGKPSLKGMQLALDDIAKDNPKAKNLTVQQLIDLSFLP